MTNSTSPTLLNTLSSKNLQAPLSLEAFFNDVVKPTGYPFFEWEACVYQVTADGAYKYTGFGFDTLTVDEDTVLQYAVSLGYWGSVNSLIADIRSQVSDRLGSDYRNPSIDE